MKNLFFVLSLLLSFSSFSHAQDPDNIPVSLEGAVFNKAEVEHTSDDGFMGGRDESAKEQDVEFKAPDGKIYTVGFPAGLSQKLIIAYTQKKKTFYLDQSASRVRKENFYRFSELSNKFQTEFYQLNDAQKQELDAAYAKTNPSIPLRSQPMANVINFIYSLSEK